MFLHINLRLIIKVFFQLVIFNRRCPYSFHRSHFWNHQMSNFIQCQLPCRMKISSLEKIVKHVVCFGEKIENSDKHLKRILKICFFRKFIFEVHKFWCTLSLWVFACMSVWYFCDTDLAVLFKSLTWFVGSNSFYIFSFSSEKETKIYLLSWVFGN
jgi:hypothetical protein